MSSQTKSQFSQKQKKKINRSTYNQIVQSSFYLCALWKTFNIMLTISKISKLAKPDDKLWNGFFIEWNSTELLFNLLKDENFSYMFSVDMWSCLLDSYAIA